MQGADERRRLGTRRGHPEGAPVSPHLVVSLYRALITEDLAAHTDEFGPGVAPVRHVGL